MMDGNKCILQLRGVRPFFSDKYDITKHKRYKELSDYDKRNEFDVEAYMRHRMEVKLTRSEEFDLYVFSEDSLMEQENNENKEAEHVENPTTELFFFALLGGERMHRYERPPIRAEPVRIQQEFISEKLERR